LLNFICKCDKLYAQ